MIDDAAFRVLEHEIDGVRVNIVPGHLRSLIERDLFARGELQLDRAFDVSRQSHPCGLALSDVTRVPDVDVERSRAVCRYVERRQAGPDDDGIRLKRSALRPVLFDAVKLESKYDGNAGGELAQAVGQAGMHVDARRQRCRYGYGGAADEDDCRGKSNERCRCPHNRDDRAAEAECQEEQIAIDPGRVEQRERDHRAQQPAQGTRTDTVAVRRKMHGIS